MLCALETLLLCISASGEEGESASGREALSSLSSPRFLMAPAPQACPCLLGQCHREKAVGPEALQGARTRRPGTTLS